MKEHTYNLVLEWTGNKGLGTKDYQSYERSYSINYNDKSTIYGSSDPAFKGDPKKWNPEELLLASLSSCHMLWYLHICSNHQIVISSYVDRPEAIMVVEASGTGYFQEVVLRPSIVITNPARIADAERLHDEAHHKCFIANSVNFPVKVVPHISD